MYILFILFFTSLVGITIMIGRKLTILKNGNLVIEDKIPFEVPHLKKIKHFTIANIKKYEHWILVEILRLYVRGTNFFKIQYQKIKVKIINRKKVNNVNGEKKEISKFLKIIGDYKQKIREIKHKIKKEEDL